MNKSKTVANFSESELIQRLTQILGYWGNNLISGSDDAVAFPISDPIHHIVVWKTDMLVSTTDVPPQMTYYQAAKKAVVMNCSDLYVKGVIPKWAVIALGLPASLPLEGDHGFDGLIRGLSDACKDHHVVYLGGDLGQTKELIISMTIAGEAESIKVIRRNGAQNGDLLYTTGEYGLTGLGLQLLLHPEKLPVTSKINLDPCINAVLNPKTDSLIGIQLAKLGWANASADSSDGLLKTVDEISNASHLGVIIEWEKIPIASCVQAYFHQQKIPDKSFVLAAGEEFTHLFAISPHLQQQVEKQFGAELNCIGKFTQFDQGKILINEAHQRVLFSSLKLGYEHFSD